MDRPLIKTPWQRHQKSVALGLVIAVFASLWLATVPGSDKVLRVKREDLILAEVEQGVFENFIPLRGLIRPLNTLYLDAIEGGRVEKVYVEDGAELAAGDLIVDISNTRLQLESITREAQVSEQINLMQTQELNLTRNALEHKRNLHRLAFDIDALEVRLSRMAPLTQAGHVAQAELEDAHKQLRFLRLQRELTLEARDADEALQAAQMKQLQGSIKNLRSNLAFARNNLESLRVKAPVAGRLTAFNLQVGQSLMPGERFGQIDDPHAYKLVAMVDEFYMRDVFVGQSATTQLNGQEYSLEIQKIYPQVISGQFQIDLEFHQDQPAQLSRGQGVQLRLQMGENTLSHIIPLGSFYADTGGQWIFVVSSDGKSAYRKSIKLGRRNSHSIEVLEGLAVGETVVVSNYLQYNDIDQLNF
jgi:HlyD family secretion protein